MRQPVGCVLDKLPHRVGLLGSGLDLGQQVPFQLLLQQAREVIRMRANLFRVNCNARATVARVKQASSSRSRAVSGSPDMLVSIYTG